MSVDELSSVHKTYVEYSGQFKAAWTFHQFLQGLKKIQDEAAIESYSIDFQSLYEKLKAISGQLKATTAAGAKPQLMIIGREVSRIHEQLLNAESEVTPATLRQFFNRVKNYDDNIVAQLVRFYLFAKKSTVWSPDRLDKVDFLITKLGEEAQGPNGPYLMRSRTQLREIFQSFWSIVGGGSPLAADRRESATGEFNEIKEHLEEVVSFDDLIDGNLIKRYRAKKHALNDLFFEPEILLAIVECNLVIRNKLSKLYRKEERRIVTDYQEIFDLESKVRVDKGLETDMSDFRKEVENFENQLQRQEMSVEDLAKIRRQVRSLVPRLKAKDGTGNFSSDETHPVFDMPESGELHVLQEEGSFEPHAHLSKFYFRIMEVLSDTNPKDTLKAVAYSPAAFEYRLEVREVLAYRRVTDDQGELELEQFILEAAAIRARVEEEVAEIRAILDESAVTREAPVYERARKTVQVASEFEHRFSHKIESSILRMDAEETRWLQFLRMRLARSSAGLWLLVYRAD